MEGITTPALFLTAKAEIEDRVTGLDAGADDYLPKPFDASEFLTRVRALTRRSSAYTPSRLTLGNTTLDYGTYQLRTPYGETRLNNKEYQLMELFLRNPQQVFSSEHLIERIWGLDSESEMGVIWTYIGFLRKKLRQIWADIELKTIRSLLFITLAVAGGSLLLVFALVVLFSGRAIAPYLRNLAAQKQFITNASHELKTPLAIISVNAEAIEMMNGKNDWTEGILKAAKTNGCRTSNRNPGGCQGAFPALSRSAVWTRKTRSRSARSFPSAMRYGRSRSRFRLWPRRRARNTRSTLRTASRLRAAARRLASWCRFCWITRSNTLPTAA